MKSLSPSEWHNRFIQQAGWTAQLRTFIFRQLNLTNSASILEIGSGTGVVLSEIGLTKTALRIALDLRFDFLRYSCQVHPKLWHLNANGFHLPFGTDAISTTLCHFLLLWVKDPIDMISEMRRVTKPGGFVVALAEPDYGGRIDHPAELVHLGQRQAKALLNQGANPYLGRKLHGLFHQAGLENVQSGILGGHWGEPPSPEAWDSEWNTLEQDLAGSISAEEFHNLRQLDAAAWQKGERILFVPTFYAWGSVPE